LANATAQQREFAYTDADFRYVVEQAKRHAGIALADHKRDMVYSRLARRVRALGLSSIREYCDLLESARQHEEIGHFVNAITTNLTSFYREAHHFIHLKEQLAKARKGQRIRLWSAGCSAGMEPYTMALTAIEALGNLQQYDIRILATDIDTNILDRAARGMYPQQDMEKVPRELLMKFFARREEGKEVFYEAGEELKRIIAFKPLNLMGEWPMKGPFDAIFCRNVMIYFDKPTQDTLLTRFGRLLKPQAHLYLGHSESVRGLEATFRLLNNTIYQKVG